MLGDNTSFSHTSGLVASKNADITNSISVDKTTKSNVQSQANESKGTFYG